MKTVKKSSKRTNKKVSNAGKSRKRPGGGFLPGSEKIYTKEVVVQLMLKVKNFLWKNKDISLDTELKANLEYSKIMDARTYDYIYYKQYKDDTDIQAIKDDIDGMLEFRKCKDKKMYPGIAAMALKNKHGWKDKTETELQGEISVIKRIFKD